MLPGTIVSSFITFLTYIIFWLIIFDNVPSFSDDMIGEWTQGDILVLIGFAQISSGISMAIFMGVTEISNYVTEYGLEDVLIFPMHPILYIVAYNFYPFGLLTSFFGLILIVISAMIYNIPIYLMGFLLGLMILILGNVAIYLIYGIISSFGFWLGKLTKVEELIDKGANSFDQIPTTILPPGVFIFFSYIYPIFFLSTYPTILATKIGIWSEFLTQLLILPVLIGLLVIIQSRVFSRGLRRYKSIGG